MLYKCYLLNKSNYMKIIFLLNIFDFKIIVQTNLNNEYLSSPNHDQVFGLFDFVIRES